MFKEHETCKHKGHCEKIDECYHAHLIKHELTYLIENGLKREKSAVDNAVENVTCQHPNVKRAKRKVEDYFRMEK